MSAVEMARTKRHLAQVSRMGEIIGVLRRMKEGGGPVPKSAYRTPKVKERVQRCLNVYNSLNAHGLTSSFDEGDHGAGGHPFRLRVSTTPSTP